MWTDHLRQANISQAADERSAQPGQLHEQSLVLLFNHLVLMLDALQVLLHRRDLQHTAADYQQRHHFIHILIFN